MDEFWGAIGGGTAGGSRGAICSRLIVHAALLIDSELSTPASK